MKTTKLYLSLRNRNRRMEQLKFVAAWLSLAAFVILFWIGIVLVVKSLG